MITKILKHHLPSIKKEYKDISELILYFCNHQQELFEDYEPSFVYEEHIQIYQILRKQFISPIEEEDKQKLIDYTYARLKAPDNTISELFILAKLMFSIEQVVHCRFISELIIRICDSITEIPLEDINDSPESIFSLAHEEPKIPLPVDEKTLTIFISDIFKDSYDSVCERLFEKIKKAPELGHLMNEEYKILFCISRETLADVISEVVSRKCDIISDKLFEKITNSSPLIYRGSQRAETEETKVNLELALPIAPEEHKDLLLSEEKNLTSFIGEVGGENWDSTGNELFKKLEDRTGLVIIDSSQSNALKSYTLGLLGELYQQQNCFFVSSEYFVKARLLDPLNETHLINIGINILNIIKYKDHLGARDYLLELIKEVSEDIRKLYNNHPTPELLSNIKIYLDISELLGYKTYLVDTLGPSIINSKILNLSRKNYRGFPISEEKEEKAEQAIYLVPAIGNDSVSIAGNDSEELDELVDTFPCSIL